MATKKAAKKAKKKTAKKGAAKKKGAKKTSRRGRAGYSQAEREKLLAEYDAKRASGMRAQDAAQALGVSYLSLLRWRKEAGGEPAKPAKRGRKPKAAQPQGRQAKAKAKTASRKVRSTRQKARKAAGGAYTLTIEGQGTNIRKDIDEDIMSQIVKMVF